MRFWETRAQYITDFIGNLEYSRHGRGRFPCKAVFVHLGMSINHYIVTVWAVIVLGVQVQ